MIMIPKPLTRFLLLALAVLSAGCVRPVTDLTGTVTGKVTDAVTNLPLSGATVQITPGGTSLTTGADGSFEFKKLDPGQYKIQVQKYDYQANFKQITVVSGRTASADIPLLPVEKNDNLSVSPTQLYFDGTTPELTFTVRNTGTSGPINWQITNVSVPWISVSPLEGTTDMDKSSQVKVTVDYSQVPEATSTILTVEAAGGSLSVMVNVDPDGGNQGGDGDGGQDKPGNVTNGLYAWFAFEDNLQDSRGNVTATGSGTEFVSGYDGGKALRIPAQESKKLHIPEGLIDNREMTVCFWAKELNDGHIFHVVRGSDNEPMFALAMKDGALKFTVTYYHLNYSYADCPSFTHGDLTDGWHHIALVSDFNVTEYAQITTRLYVDGQFTDQVMEENNPFSETEGMADKKHYGKGIRFQFGGAMNGYNISLDAAPLTVDNFRVYRNRCLSADEIRQIYDYEK